MARKKAHVKVRSQARIPGMTRTPAYSGLIPALERCVRQDMARFNVSRSFAIAAAAARGYGLTEQEQFDDRPRRVSNHSHLLRAINGGRR